MICYVCDEDKWKSLDGISKEGDLRVCQECGNVAYKVEEADEEKTKEYYRKHYRPIPNHENLLTTTRKLGYIKSFLKDYLKDKKGLVCGDVGCATGYIINWLRGLGHKATGSELTLTFRRFCEHFYSAPIPEELETKHKYDLISIYHVLEHLIVPDKKLKNYVSLLKDDGRVFVSTPEWLNVLEEASGSQMTSFEHLFPKPHINLFTEQSIKNLFSRCGLLVEKWNDIQYGQTYLLKKGGNGGIVKENPAEIEKKLWDTKKAIGLYKQKKWKEAIAVWPKFPEAWIQMVFQMHGKDPVAQKEIFDKAHEAVGDNCRLAMAHASWLYQQQHLKEAADQLEWLEEWRPNEDIYTMLGHCYAQSGSPVKAMSAFYQAQQINPMRWQLMMDAICREASNLPTWDERATFKAMEELKKGIKAPEFKDTAMEKK